MYRYREKILSPKAAFFGKYVFLDNDEFGVLMTDTTTFAGYGWSKALSLAFQESEFGKAFQTLPLEAMQATWKGYVSELEELVEKSRSLPQNLDYWAEHFFPIMSNKLKLLEFTFRIARFRWIMDERKKRNDMRNIEEGKENDL